jgi:hypothetical protein
MKPHVIVFWFLVSSILLTAQQNRPARLVSPEVHANRSVTFRFQATHAVDVKLDLEGVQTLPMHKDAQGVWSGTTGPLDPDYYGYSILVDVHSIL